MIRTQIHGPVTRIELARTILGRGRYWTVAYLLDSTLIDSGPAHTAEELLQHLKGTPITQILNTHTHEDHIGANGPLQQQPLSPDILLHPAGVPVLANPREEQPLQLYRRIFWGWPEPSYGVGINDGDLIATPDHRLKVLYTPGHSPDHLCLYEPDRGWLFTGDLYVGGQDRALGAEYDIWGILSALKRINRLDIQTLFPGSARIPEDPHLALSTKIEYLEEMGRKVLEFHGRGWSTQAIARKLFGGVTFIELMTAGHFSRANLVRSFLRPRAGSQPGI